MPVKDAEGGSPVSTLEVNQTSQHRGAHRTAIDVDPERPDQPYEEARYPHIRHPSALAGCLQVTGCMSELPVS